MGNFLCKFIAVGCKEFVEANKKSNITNAARDNSKGTVTFTAIGGSCSTGKMNTNGGDIISIGPSMTFPRYCVNDSRVYREKVSKWKCKTGTSGKNCEFATAPKWELLNCGKDRNNNELCSNNNKQFPSTSIPIDGTLDKWKICTSVRGNYLVPSNYNNCPNGQIPTTRQNVTTTNKPA